MFNVGDWGWLIGAALGALLYVVLMSQSPQAASVPAE